MLVVYHSNQLDLLKSLMGELMQQIPLDNPLTKEIILVQSYGMADWLQIELAKQMGIAANLDFMLPEKFIWRMFIQLLPNIPAETTFNQTIMVWKLIALLPTVIDSAPFTPLRRYLDESHPMENNGLTSPLSPAHIQRKYYQLACRIADLFDQYLVYRPEWLNAWQQEQYVPGLDESQHWQAALWRELLVYTAQCGHPVYHRANLYQMMIDKLNGSKSRPKQLPQRLFICGIAAFPPMYLQLLQALGQHSDIHLMLTNPCRFYWGELNNQPVLTRLHQPHHLSNQQNNHHTFSVHPANQTPLFCAEEANQPLLASWGKLGRDNLYLLAQLEGSQEIDAFVDLDGKTLLSRLQGDILALRDRSMTTDHVIHWQHSQHKMRLDLDDRSLTFHACHSPQREVEILYDNLLALLDKTHPAYLATLKPRDIIVMTPDIDKYTPYIQAVFANAPKARYLPFTISDRRTKEIHPILHAFLMLLTLPQSRFTIDEILTLLEVKALAEHFAIDDIGLKTLRIWIEESGIRWGLDDETVTDLNLPATGKNTWQFGLKRMLLGYAMESEQGIWQNLLPFDSSSGLIASLIGQFADFLQALQQWRQELIIARPLSAWRPICQQLLNHFFAVSEETEEVLFLITQQWSRIIDHGLMADYQEEVPLILLFDELNHYFNEERISQQFLAGAINFCTMMPMRSIPFKVICLLGMNDDSFPRMTIPLSFDLMRQQTKPGDRSRRDDDRYLFLEALLSAQQLFYISYIGHSIQDNTPRYPSVLVNELLDYVAQSHVLVGDEQLDSDTSAERVTHHLVRHYSRMPFHQQNFIRNDHYQSYAQQWLPAANITTQQYKPFIKKLSTIATPQIDIADLRRFYRHPVKAFFKHRLHVQFHFNDHNVEPEEPFNLTALERYQIQSQLLEVRIKGQEGEQLFNQLKAAGKLPYGAFAELIWRSISEDIDLLADKIKTEKQIPQQQEIDIALTSGHLTGWLDQVQTDGLLRWRAGKLSILDGFALWIDHLAYCAMGGTQDSRMYGHKQSEWRFTALSQQQARIELQQLIDGYRQGLTEPLLFIPKCGWEWVTACYDKDTQMFTQCPDVQKKAKDRVLKVWHGHHNEHHSDANDSYYQRLFLELDEEHLQQILTVSEYYLQPLLKFRQ